MIIHNSRHLLSAVFFVAFLFYTSSFGQVLTTKEAIIENAFAGCDTVLRKVLFLNENQAKQIEKEAKARLESKLVTYYQGINKGMPKGYAFFEKNVVRTKPETFMVFVKPDGSVGHVEMLAFYEPPDYLPAANWFQLFQDKKLDKDLWPKRSIHNVTGATLTVRAVTQGVRKILAIYQIAVANKEAQN